MVPSVPILSETRISRNVCSIEGAVEGEQVALEGFDLVNDIAVVAVCRKDKRKARVALESIEFPDLTPIEARWLKAWKQFSKGLG
jgi:hypothetical protein